MKTTIYKLLGMIKDGKAPYKIFYDDRVYIFDNFEQDYLAEGDHYLFDEYIVVDILDDEVEILDTTIILNNFNYLQKLAEDEIPDKIEKLKIITKKTECGHNHHYLVNDNRDYRLREVDKIILDKINEIIDYIQKEN